MKNTKVVNLGMVRDMLTELDKVRAHIVAGRITGFQAMLCDTEQQETVYLGGVYQEDPQLALRSQLRLSAARALTEDEPPLFQSGTY